MKKIYQTLTPSLPHSSREQAKLGSLVTTEWDLAGRKSGIYYFSNEIAGVRLGIPGCISAKGK